MFFGTYMNSIDDKGRCMIPAKLRTELGDECFVVPGVDRNIRIYAKEVYIKFLDDHMRNRPAEDPAARRMLESSSANSHLCQIDKQGRVNIPQQLVDYAAIEKETVTVGNIDYITIWSKEIHDLEMNLETMDRSALFESMLKYGSEK